MKTASKKLYQRPNAWLSPSRWRQKNEKSKYILVQLMLDYANNSTLHGLRYTTGKGRVMLEKIFWLLTVLVSLGFCLYLTHNVWVKWNSSPLIVGFNQKLIPVEMVPFPSITICPQVKVKASYFNYTEKLQRILRNVYVNGSKFDGSESLYTRNLKIKEGLKEFLDVSLICSVPFYFDMKYLVTLPGSLTTNHSTVETIIKVSPKKDCLRKCSWLGVEYNCSEIFDTVLTEEGVCFNFNGVAEYEMFRMNNIQKEYKYNEAKRRTVGWDTDTGYYIQRDKNRNPYPYTGKFNKRSPVFEMLLASRPSEHDKFCNIINKGFNVYLQHPASQPQSSVYSYHVLPRRVSSLAITVTVFNTSKSLMSYKPEARQCYFGSERYLRYFRVYTSLNCMLECMSNFTFKACKCVSFHMPHFDSRSICSIQNEECIRRTRVSEEFISHVDNECSCLPHCTFIVYETEVLESSFHFKSSIRTFYNMIGETVPDYIEKYDYSKLEVYFRDPKYVSIIRSELFGFTELFANIGGLLGLFMGFSILSFVEFVYFFTIRYYLTLKKAMKDRTEGQIKSSKVNIFNVEKRNYIE